MDKNVIFDALRNLLKSQPLKIGEICDKLNMRQKDVLEVLKSNPYSFEYRVMLGSKVWICF